MIWIIVIFFVLLLVAIVVVTARRTNPVIYKFDDEVVATVAPTEPTAPVVPDSVPRVVSHFTATITRGWEDNTPYLFDPVNGEKIMLTQTNNQYKDAGGKIWKLV